MSPEVKADALAKLNDIGLRLGKISAPGINRVADTLRNATAGNATAELVTRIDRKGLISSGPKNQAALFS
jgi:hypothetical protein